ncbi:DEAD-domain-containing protein [Delitschia confertaspora ATCC 74209]|uniref:ATP-dependent RNA helicase n=1 Tax=Delitschia confertaspora ATCC 74209 TaxID=1513339 RepID=A0A9P4JBM3_9PLEO|nr:DEAD-domain-containing protein [Delitschia confertaspora ATCC 74209]
MFATLRRCPASLSRNVSTAAFSYRVLRSALSQSSPAVWRTPARTPTVTIAAFHRSAIRWQEVAASATAEEVEVDNTLVTKFEDLKTRGLIHPNIVDTITRDMKLTTMTDVQTRTINEALSGSDVIAQARTGTGKTLGFLIPTVQKIISENPELGKKVRGYKRAKPNDIRAIIISPTRELAEQIAVEAAKLTFNTGILVQVAVGGTQKREMLRKVQREGCHLLIGTPGRLADILSDPYSGVEAPHLNSLVLDEADRLLDAGFDKEIEEIKKYLPDTKEVDRQTLMFSATVPRDVVDLVRKTLKPGFHFAQCVKEDEVQTHERVPQKVIHVKALENIMPTLYEMISKEIKKGEETGRPFKAILYFNSTAEVTLAAKVFAMLTRSKRQMFRNRIENNENPFSRTRTYEIHAKLTQAGRTRASDSFRHAESAILFSSDVTARGMDFPNVTHVIQVGLPRDRETYIHRLGRTARAGKEGEGWLVANPLERNEIGKRLRGMKLSPETSSEIAHLDLTTENELPENVASLIGKVVDAHQDVDPEILNSAFLGFFGSYQWHGDKEGLVEMAKRWALHGWNYSSTPSPPATLYNSGRRGGSRGGSFQRSSGGFSRGGDRQSSGGFGDRRSGGGFSGDRQSRGGFGGDRQSRGGFGADRQSRGGFEPRGGYGDRPARGGNGDRPQREGYGDRRSGGNRYSKPDYA